MIKTENIKIEDYNYSLPKEKIAQFPLDNRHDSKLVILDENINENVFFNINEYLPENSLLISNDTKVIQARILFQKPSGANIEIFCLEAVFPSNDFQLVFEETKKCRWKCLLGNSKKWKSGTLSKTITINNADILLSIKKISTEGNSWIIEFNWDSDNSFAQIIESAGIVPLPPYMNRDAIDSDKERYQTIYALNKGSVAAPTAGLHFTDEVVKKLDEKNIKREYVTLHVGAGTFKPVSSELVKDHEMHSEQIIITRNLIENIIKYEANIISVGTTTLRTLESIYWIGVKLLVEDINEIPKVNQWDPYDDKYSFDIPLEKSLRAIIQFMDVNNIDEVKSSTQLIIIPSYKIRTANALITNFHQPKSTLLLLVASFIGEKWKDVYEYCLNNNFRFLSYGDSCLFFRK